MLGAGELSVSQRIQWWRWTQGRLLELGTGKWGAQEDGGETGNLREVGRYGVDSTWSVDSRDPGAHEAGHQEGQEPQVHCTGWFSLLALRANRGGGGKEDPK